MGKISLFFTFFSRWETGKWLLLSAILMLVFCLFAPNIILHRIVSPRADFGRNGWWILFYAPSHPVGVERYEVFLPAGEIVALNPDFKQARGYLLWDVPVTGPYCFKLETDDYGTLSVDGKIIATMTPDHPGKQRIDAWAHLTKGLHLFQIRMRKETGGGGFSVGFMTPPMMNSRILAGDDTAVPALGSLDFWWWVMTVAGYGLMSAWVFASFCTLILVLPLSLQNRPVSVLATITVAILPALFIPVTVQREPYIGKMVQQELEAEKPDFVFIGNSMLWSRIDDDYLGRLLGGKKVHSIVNFGGLSAVHYLAFKYLLYPANIHPKRVFIFFRGNQFILPGARTDDPFVKKIIQRLTPAPDPLFEQIVHGDSRSMTDIVYDRLLALFPVAAAQAQIRKEIHKLALIPVTFGSTGDNPKKILLGRVNKRFSFTEGSFRSEIGTESRQREDDGNSYDFYGRVDKSFLPNILKLAEKKRIPLAFIRVQERPTENGNVPDPPELKKYMQDMRTYLEEHGAALYDFTGDPELPLSAYHDGDHIKDQKKYTKLFVRRVGDLLQ